MDKEITRANGMQFAPDRNVKGGDLSIDPSIAISLTNNNNLQSNESSSSLSLSFSLFL